MHLEQEERGIYSVSLQKCFLMGSGIHKLILFKCQKATRSISDSSGYLTERSGSKSSRVSGNEPPLWCFGFICALKILAHYSSIQTTLTVSNKTKAGFSPAMGIISIYNFSSAQTKQQSNAKPTAQLVLFKEFNIMLSLL